MEPITGPQRSDLPWEAGDRRAGLAAGLALVCRRKEVTDVVEGISAP
jgi:hypothetical protein